MNLITADIEPLRLATRAAWRKATDRTFGTLPMCLRSFQGDEIEPGLFGGLATKYGRLADPGINTGLSARQGHGKVEDLVPWLRNTGPK